jgi:hypothetical protein
MNFQKQYKREKKIFFLNIHNMKKQKNQKLNHFILFLQEVVEFCVCCCLCINELMVTLNCCKKRKFCGVSQNNIAENK